MISNKDRRLVLAFNSCKRLVGIFHSSLATAKALQSSTQSVHYACTGRCMSVKNLYFRAVPEDFCLSLDNLGSMNLLKFDELCGVKRKVYATKEMTRKGMKYKRAPK